MASKASADKDKHGKDTNMDVDYVLSYRFDATGRILDLWLQRTIADAEKRKQTQLRTLRNWSTPWPESVWLRKSVSETSTHCSYL